MSLIVAIQIPTGLVLSGDSRSTITPQKTYPDPSDPARTILEVQQVVLSDAAFKIFRVYDRFGIGTYGAGTVNNLPIAHYVEQFELENKAKPPANTEELANGLLDYFSKLTPIPATSFIVVGYDADPQLYLVDVNIASISRKLYDGPSGVLSYGAQWGGDIDIVNRLFSNPANNPPWNLLNLQDAADLSRHLIRSTIDQLRFEPRYASVGGPIDTLVVTPRGCEFLEQKGWVAR